MPLFEPRTSVVTIFTGDYLDRIRHLEQRARAAERAAKGTTQMLDEEPEYLRLAEEHDALVREAEESAVHVRVQALPRKVWTQLVSEHPPRDGNRDDTLDGVNTDTFPEALVTVVGRTKEGGPSDRGFEYRTVTEPAGLTDADLEGLASVDFTRLYVAAFRLNRGVPEDPKASLVSQMTQPKDETSS